MKKSKIILLFSVIIYVYIITSNMIYKTYYQNGEVELIGTITNISVTDKTVLEIKAKEKIKATYYGTIHYKIGDKVKIKGELKEANNNTIFNLYNYKKYLMSNKIYHIMTIKEINLVKKNTNILYKIKNSIYERINNLNSSAYLKAFILGDKTGLDDIKNIISENGISHLLAISGMHISLLAGIVSLILKKIKNNHIIISLFLIFYAFLVSFTPSVIRSVVFFIFKNKDKRQLLLTITMILLVYNPYYIYNAGFLFSYIISFYLITFNNLINNHKNYFVKLLITSTISFLASIPILINNFYNINITSIITNLFFVPFVSFILFPFCLITLLFPMLDKVLVFLINIFESTSLFFNNFNINITLAKVPLYILILYYLVITLVLKRPKYFYILLIIILFHYNIKHFNQNIYVTISDVSQGDSILLEIKNKTVLLDTGGLYNNNLTTTRLVPHLKSKGIKKIDYLVLTHGDYDHMGESINLINNFKVDNVIFNCGEFNELEQNLIKVLNKKKIPYYSCIKELSINNNKLYFLNNKIYDNENDNSNVIYTKFNNYKFLFMGDAGVEVEEDIIKKHNLKNITVLKVGHHGSKTSSSKEFISAIKPEYSIISVGKNNRYGHPNDNVLGNLNSSHIYRTDQDGSVMFKIKNSKLKIETCPP